MVHNECVGTGDWEPLAEWFTEDAEFVFEGVPVGPFEGRDEIAAAYRERPPDDQGLIFGVEEDEGTVAARYGWAADEPNKQAGRMLLTPRGAQIATLVRTLRAGGPPPRG